MTILDRVPAWLAPGVLGALAHHLWTRFKTRITILPYQIEHRYLGGSAADAYFGTLKVLHNNIEVRNVYMSSVTFKNESAQDLHDLELNIAATDAQTVILISYGKMTSSVKYLSFTDEFQNKLEQAGKDAQVVTWNHRDYKIPVLNRGDGVTVELLTTHGGGQQPSLTVGCDHPGVRFKAAPAVPLIYGEPQAKSTWLGLLAVAALWWLIVERVENKPLAVGLGALVGVFSLGLGVGLRKLYRLILKGVS